MKLLHKGILVAAGLVVAAPASAAELIVGAPIALTGIYAFVGKPGLQGMQLAVEEANAAGLPGGNTIKLIAEDDGSDRTQSVTLTTRMALRDNALIIVGAAGTTPAIGSAAVAKDQQIPLLALATSPVIPQTSPWSLKVMAGPTLQIDAIMRYVHDKLKPKTVATLWTRDNEGAVAQGKFARQWLEGKATLLPEESVLNAATDFSAIVTKLAAANPDMIFVTMSENNSANFITQARQGGLNAQIVGPTTMVGPGFLRTGGAAVEGILAPADYFAGRPDKLSQDFLANFKKKFNETPDNWAALGYNAMQVAIRAIAAAGPNPTRAAVREAMDKTKDMPSILGAGLYSFDKDREPSYEMAIVTVKGGQFTLAPK